jgi:sucrose phosphorylase
MNEPNDPNGSLPQGVIFNAYPDSIGRNLADTVQLLKRAEFKDAFSSFYILPTVFNSDLDRGFSIIDYDLNERLVSRKDLNELNQLNITFKFDLVVNHLSVASPQFKDLLKYGDQSKYRDFFIDWNDFWYAHGTMGPEGYVIPHAKHLDKLFMRKPGLPILMVRFPDGSDRPYWNTFYQQVDYPAISARDLQNGVGKERLTLTEAETIAVIVNVALDARHGVKDVDFGKLSPFKEEVVSFVEKKRRYLGQMDLNAQSWQVWDYYDETLKKLRNHGGKIIRLDAFAYLHKKPGEVNFFNKPGTWEYLARLKEIARKHDLILLPELHSAYGQELHEEIAARGFPIYDFFFPCLVIHALDESTNKYLLRWINELTEKNLKTINMLGCHDGIPVLDLKGGQRDGISRKGLLSDEQIEAIIDRVVQRGGRVKNLYGADGKRIAYYQVNATFFSALGEDERKFLLARAIQMFMPGTPQVWYLDLFAGKNDYAAADRGGTAGHKEINRTTLSIEDIEQALKRNVVKDQLELIRLRNTSPAFYGKLSIGNTDERHLHMTWNNRRAIASLHANLIDYSFIITQKAIDSNTSTATYN